MAARGLVSRIAFAFSPTSAPLQPAGDAEAGRKRRDEWNGRWDAVFEDSDSDATRGGMPDSPEWPNGPPRYFEDGDGRSRCCSFFLASRTLRTVILTALATALVTYFVVAGDGSAWKNVVSGSLDVPGIVDDADAIIPPPDDEMVADDFETEPVVPVADNFATETSEAIVGSSSTTSISTSPSPALIPSPPPCPSAAPIPAPPAPASPAAPTQPPLEPEKDQFELPDFPNLLSTSSPLTTWPLINPPKDKFHRVPPGIPRPFCPIKAFDEYARWHAKILSGDFSSVEKDPDPEHRRPRFIIYTCRPHVDGQQDPCGGLADRIVGIVTTVMFGMLSGRVALVDFQRDTKATDVFMPVGIDWTVVIEDFVAKHNLNASGDYRTLRLNYHNPTKRAVEQLSTMKFDDWWHEPIVRIEINRGLTWMMYDNPHYKTQIKRWAWNRENLFACLMDCGLKAIRRQVILLLTLCFCFQLFLHRYLALPK